MRYCNQGRFRQQVRFLRRQFLQDGDLPFATALSEATIAPALKSSMHLGRIASFRHSSPCGPFWARC